MNAIRDFEDSDKKILCVKDKTKDEMVDVIAKAQESGIVFFDLKNGNVIEEPSEVLRLGAKHTLGYGRLKGAETNEENRV